MARILAAAVLAGATLLATAPADAEIGIGADVVSRYVFRGSDAGGDGVNIQPSISCAKDNLEIGAWSSWSITSAANENDLYVTYSMESVDLTVTDYYNPPAEFLDYDEGHRLSHNRDHGLDRSRHRQRHGSLQRPR